MAVQDPTGTDAIEINFCQRCGISIPQADIDSGRARAAPGGYVCVGCIYQQRDGEMHPRPARAAGAPAASGGGRALVAVALLYVVGATTFLLYKELNRKPPQIDLRSLARAGDVKELGRKVDAVDGQWRDAAAQLKSNDNLQRADLRKLDDGLRRVEERVVSEAALSKKRHDDLSGSVLEIGRRTVGLDEDVEEVLEELRGLGETIKERKVPDPGGPAPIPGPTPPKQTPGEDGTAEDAELALKIAKYAAQLRDKKADKQSRFNAAAELGDLNDPRAVDPLVAALAQDPYHLVRRACAYYLGMLGKHAVRSIPHLIAQMDDKDEYVGYQCERALGKITEAALGAAQTFHFDPTLSRKKRRDIQKQWEEWWEKMKPRLLPEAEGA
jgi:hypothetical protein